MFILVLAFLIGVVAGLRAMTAPAAVSWAAHLGLLPLQGTPLAWLGYAFTPYIFTVLALGELINDKLPKTPSRTVPPQFIARVISGSLVGAAILGAGQPAPGAEPPAAGMTLTSFDAPELPVAFKALTM